ncbi:hypothetical protein BT67DRAFT_156151 [Trichocladium antarcticum]|uniref:Uncharacterized protein n=1 Tax=Trichocladium antarcticum TaxID=1450529 RepID=A0AAN6UEE4_9PEZI|nr:hypothetical protein BT67DRAFT_156151 [Trichocladium antarcticum]
MLDIAFALFATSPFSPDGPQYWHDSRVGAPGDRYSCLWICNSGDTADGAGGFRHTYLPGCATVHNLQQLASPCSRELLPCIQPCVAPQPRSMCSDSSAICGHPPPRRSLLVAELTLPRDDRSQLRSQSAPIACTPLAFHDGGSAHDDPSCNSASLSHWPAAIGNTGASEAEGFRRASGYRDQLAIAQPCVRMNISPWSTRLFAIPPRLTPSLGQYFPLPLLVEIVLYVYSGGIFEGHLPLRKRCRGYVCWGMRPESVMLSFNCHPATCSLLVKEGPWGLVVLLLRYRETDMSAVS